MIDISLGIAGILTTDENNYIKDACEILVYVRHLKSKLKEETK
jgi:hypothetical protein